VAPARSQPRVEVGERILAEHPVAAEAARGAGSNQALDPVEAADAQQLAPELRSDQLLGRDLGTGSTIARVTKEPVETKLVEEPSRNPTLSVSHLGFGVRTKGARW